MVDGEDIPGGELQEGGDGQLSMPQGPLLCQAMA